MHPKHLCSDRIIMTKDYLQAQAQAVRDVRECALDLSQRMLSLHWATELHTGCMLAEQGPMIDAVRLPCACPTALRHGLPPLWQQCKD